MKILFALMLLSLAAPAWAVPITVHAPVTVFAPVTMFAPITAWPTVTVVEPATLTGPDPILPLMLTDTTLVVMTGGGAGEPPIEATPEPATLLLLGMALAGMGWWKRRGR